MKHATKYVAQISLSVAVIALFIIYSIYQRQQGPAKLVAVAGSSAQMQPPRTYKDGSYTGPVTNAYYGNVQVAVVINNHKISSVSFLQQPHASAYSQFVNGQAVPQLRQEALKVQSSKVNVVSGATQTSGAFMKSLAAALAKS